MNFPSIGSDAVEILQKRMAGTQCVTTWSNSRRTPPKPKGQTDNKDKGVVYTWKARSVLSEQHKTIQGTAPNQVTKNPTSYKYTLARTYGQCKKIQNKT